jgi:hypothetical protein
VRREVYLAATIAAAIAWPVQGLANDRGPAAAVVAIRHDLSILLSAPLEALNAKPTIDWVVANQQDAVAMWRAKGNRGIVVLQRRSGRWWWRGAASSTDDMAGTWSPLWVPGNEIGSAECSIHLPGPPSAQKLLSDGFIDKQLAAKLANRLPTVPMPKTMTAEDCHSIENYVRSSSGGYGAAFFHGEDYDSTWFNWVGQTPTGSEGDSIQDTKACYSFTLTTLPDKSPRDMEHLVHQVYSELFPSPPPALTFKTGSTIDVWFPYVLAGHGHYLLSMSNVTPEIRDVPGTLRNNVLHFALPAFILRRGDIAQGEVVGNRASNPAEPHVPGCTSADDCYNEVINSESEQKISGGSVAVVGRYTDNGHPVSVGARFMNLDYATLATAPAETLWLTIPEPLDHFFSSVGIQLEPSPNGAVKRDLQLHIDRRDGGTIIVLVPEPAVASHTKVFGAIVRPPGIGGWYPKRYCASFYNDSDNGDVFTTISVSEFALPGRPPPVSSSVFDPSDDTGC